ncbi:hypothetical protein Anas_11605 [Armadillidium nasatum]|uniref:Uncharacterized protein n=1 Tax=Armadillidium nasatum TaxID=96803 RepID=A0A5N5SLG1_9CRUS|nr:hypothetical protein Anas_11605 [Armadillidium nasatum]
MRAPDPSLLFDLPKPSLFDLPGPSLLDLAPLVEEFLPYIESIKDFIEELPELIGDVIQKLSNAFDLANEGNLDEAKEVVKSLPFVGDFAYDIIKDIDVNYVKAFTDTFQAFLKNFGIEE